jgi:hypothetical protein
MPPVRHIQRRPRQRVVVNPLRRPPVLEHQRHRIRVVQSRRSPLPTRNLPSLLRRRPSLRPALLRPILARRIPLINIPLAIRTRIFFRTICRDRTIRSIIRIPPIIPVPQLPSIQPPIIQRPNHPIPKPVPPIPPPPIPIPIPSSALVKRRPRARNHTPICRTRPTTSVTLNPRTAREARSSALRKPSPRTTSRGTTYTTMKSTTTATMKPASTSTPTSPTPLRASRHTYRQANHRHNDQPTHPHSALPDRQRPSEHPAWTGRSCFVRLSSSVISS